MAFQFVVESGEGLDNATSYVSVTEADDYFAVDSNAAETWSDLDQSEKEKVLAWATRILDQKCDWRGYRATKTQALRWPRMGAYDRDGMYIGVNVIPVQVKHATCELAKYLLTNDPTIGRDSEPIKRVQIDVIEIEFQEQAYHTELPSIINHILSGIGYFRTGGSTFARIVKA